jgi:hypothetical protein
LDSPSIGTSKQEKRIACGQQQKIDSAPYAGDLQDESNVGRRGNDKGREYANVERGVQMESSTKLVAAFQSTRRSMDDGMRDHPKIVTQYL